MEDPVISRGRFVRCLGGRSLVSIPEESGPLAWGGPWSEMSGPDCRKAILSYDCKRHYLSSSDI